MVPCQKISAKNGRNSLLIKIFEKDKLNPRQVKSITGYFKEIFANSPIDDFEILITVTPLTDVFDAYVLFVKSNDISYYHPGFGVNVLACLREILELFIGGFNGLNINDYELSEKLRKRIEEQAEGILIAGSPGEGKSTFASALTEFYASQEKIVKTIEAPRDMQLKDEVTQYAISHASSQEIHDILLLSRPDYTVFDEMRNFEDFRLFSDLRLAGIGLAGVVHATNPVDAIQRFLGKTELGIIPHIIDKYF